MTFDIYETVTLPYPSERIHQPILTWLNILKITVAVIIIIVAIVGNSLVIATVVRVKKLRTPTNYYIVNLAVADLLVTTSCTWVNVVDDLIDSWILGGFFCVFNSFAQVLTLVCSILTLMLIACDRFFGIIFSIKAHLSERRSWSFILLVWLVSVVLSCPLLVYRKQFKRQWTDYLEIWCDDTWPYVVTPVTPPAVSISYRTSDATVTSSNPAVANVGFIVHSPSRKFYYTLICCALFFIPILVMTVVYSMISFKLWISKPPGEETTESRGYRRGTSVISNASRRPGSFGESNSRSGANARHATIKKVVKMLLVILFVFTLCWLPLQVAILYVEHRNTQVQLPESYIQFKFWANLLAHANSAANPVIYSCFSHNFRSGYRETLRLRGVSYRTSRQSVTFGTSMHHNDNHTRPCTQL